MKIKADRDRLAKLRAEIREIESGARADAKARAKEQKKAIRSNLTGGFGQRQPRVKDRPYLNWVASHPCIACGVKGLSIAAHVRSSYPEAGWSHTGMGEKPHDWRTLPLCSLCHTDGMDAQHRSNEREWWRARGIYPPDAVAALLSEREKG